MTPNDALDEMLGVFKAAWDTTGYTAAYSDQAGKPPTTEVPWARVTVRHDQGAQSSLANGIGAKKYTHGGTIFAELYEPMGDGGGQGLIHARLVLNAYRQARGAVWYRNHRFRETEPEGAFTRFLCAIDFVYDDSAT